MRLTQAIKSTLIQAGVELDDDSTAINEMIEAAGYEPVEHAVALELGEIIGPFKSVDHSLARLTPGLDWEVTYTDEEVQLGVIQSGNIPATSTRMEFSTPSTLTCSPVRCVKAPMTSLTI